jgi:hypothetical protein
VIDKDSPAEASPLFIVDSVMRVVPQDKGFNHRSKTFSNDFWLILVNYPLVLESGNYCNHAIFLWYGTKIMITGQES